MDNLQPIEETDINPHYIKTEYLTNYRFNEFEILYENIGLKLIKISAIKSCDSDLIQTNLLKEYADVLVPSIHCIITSLLQGCFTDNLMEALLRPLLKKLNADLIFKNYHPVSNLTYLSKLVERAVCDQITHSTAQTSNTEELHLPIGKTTPWKLHCWWLKWTY